MYRGEKDIIAGVKLLNYPLKFVTTRQVVHTKWHLQQTGFGKKPQFHVFLRYFINYMYVHKTTICG